MAQTGLKILHAVSARAPWWGATANSLITSTAGAVQVIRAHMMASATGPFSESFEWELGGAAEPVRLTIQGRAVPPNIKVWFAGL